VRRIARRARPTLLPAALELALVAVLFEAYRLGRLLARGDEVAAHEHAALVHRLEGLLHLPSEAGLQAVVPEAVLHLANVYYVSVHFPAMIAFLVWGYLFRPRAEYVWARNLLVTLTGTALVVHVLFPLAPPRMFPQWGFVDTMGALGPNAYAGASGALVNQFAAMPSLHVGWAALIAYVVLRTGPRWLAAVAAGHLVVTVLVVVVTANHYWLDGLVALVLLAVAVALVRPAAAQTGSRSALVSTRAAGAVSRQASKVSSASSSRSTASRWTTTQPKP
jgi:PAP2 superfamily protein